MPVRKHGRKRGVMYPAPAPRDRTTKAVIYCRVSGKKQASEGAGLESQEHRWRRAMRSRPSFPMTSRAAAIS